MKTIREKLKEAAISVYSDYTGDELIYEKVFIDIYSIIKIFKDNGWKEKKYEDKNKKLHR